MFRDAIYTSKTDFKSTQSKRQRPQKPLPHISQQHYFIPARLFQAHAGRWKDSRILIFPHSHMSCIPELQGLFFWTWLNLLMLYFSQEKSTRLIAISFVHVPFAVSRPLIFFFFYDCGRHIRFAVEALYPDHLVLFLYSTILPSTRQITAITKEHPSTTARDVMALY